MGSLPRDSAPVGPSRMFLTEGLQDILPSHQHSLQSQGMSSLVFKINVLIILMAVILFVLFSLFVICFIMLIQIYREHLRHKAGLRCADCGHQDLQISQPRKTGNITSSEPQPNRLGGQHIWTIKTKDPIYEDIERCKLGLEVPTKPVTRPPSVLGERASSSVIYSVITTKEAAKFRPVGDINIIR